MGWEERTAFEGGRDAEAAPGPVLAMALLLAGRVFLREDEDACDDRGADDAALCSCPLTCDEETELAAPVVRVGGCEVITVRAPSRRGGGRDGGETRVWPRARLGVQDAGGQEWGGE